MMGHICMDGSMQKFKPCAQHRSLLARRAPHIDYHTTFDDNILSMCALAFWIPGLASSVDSCSCPAVLGHLLPKEHPRNCLAHQASISRLWDASGHPVYMRLRAHLSKSRTWPEPVWPLLSGALRWRRGRSRRSSAPWPSRRRRRRGRTIRPRLLRRCTET